MLRGRVQKKGKTFIKDETRIHSPHRHLLLPYPGGLEAAGQGGRRGCREQERSEGGCRGGHVSSSEPRSPSHLCGARAGDRWQDRTGRGLWDGQREVWEKHRLGLLRLQR